MRLEIDKMQNSLYELLAFSHTSVMQNALIIRGLLKFLTKNIINIIVK